MNGVMGRFRWLAGLGSLVVVGLSAGGARADLEDDLQDRWEGAWVVIGVEVYSDCGAFYTDNEVRERHVRSGGDNRFPPGEIGRVNDLDLGRKSLDIEVVLAEHLLRPYREGPFTLYADVECKVQLELGVPRKAVEDEDMAAIEEEVAPVVERAESFEEGQRSERWNRRQREPYPKDYKVTLAHHAIWKAEQHNMAIDRKLEEAAQRVRELSRSSRSDDDYLDGFSEGLRKGDGLYLGTCDAMLGVSLGRSYPRDAYDKGEVDGKLLGVSRRLVKQLKKCYVEPPPLPAGVPPPAEE